jgi:site-specific recombinase XerD
VPKSNGDLPGRQQRMEPGALGALVGDFTIRLASLAYTPLTVAGYEDSARHFAQWLRLAGIAAGGIDETVVRRFAQHCCRCPGARRHDHVSAKYVNRVRRFVGFLVEQGVVPPLAEAKPAAREPQVMEFQDWLRRHRGISDRTIGRHGRMLMRLLPVLGTDTKEYNAALIRRAVLGEAGQASPAHVKTMTQALRGFLRFLAANGMAGPGLDQAVPTIPQWRLSALPRYIGVPEIERLIASCDLSMPHGVRDRAVLLLLARLGLRAGDILTMRVDDIEWEQATLRVRGKARREIRLPLPQDAGDALLAYLERARPPAVCDQVFLRSPAPYRPFSGSSVVSGIVRLALTRAGIDSAPSKGANLLRHSAATAMLRGGATLDMVGTVLRHRSPDTTAHYAKVDITALQQIAQPWPGDA